MGNLICHKYQAKMPFLHTGILNLFLSFFLLSHGYAAENDLNITEGNPLIIGVPAFPFSKEFVQINPVDQNSKNKRYSGFCIRVFEEAVKMLEYKIYYKFVECNGSYDDLVNSVSNKTFDVAVGDITVLAYRWKLVAFTEPFTESGLSVVVPLKPPKEGWIFFRPFSAVLWIATGGILVYTMFVVWFMEHRTNPEFAGSWKDQLGNALWFTFTSLFFAHREKIRSSYTRVVVVVWLFVVLILTQSYAASLTSMLTIKRLNPDIESLRSGNAKVGCDKNTMKKFVETELGYKSENIKLMMDDGDYLKAFNSGSISAAILEIPYAKHLVNSNCNQFTIIGSSIRFGGLSFAFQKRLSTLANNVSEAILQLSESGMLKRLEESWLSSSSSKCSDSQANNTDSLSFQNFWGLYLFSVAISTTCFLLFIARLLKDYRHHRRSQAGNISENVWKKMVGIVSYLKNAEPPSSSKV